MKKEEFDICDDEEFMHANRIFFMKLRELGINDEQRQQLIEPLADLQVAAQRIGYDMCMLELESYCTQMAKDEMEDMRC